MKERVLWWRDRRWAGTNSGEGGPGRQSGGKTGIGLGPRKAYGVVEGGGGWRVCGWRKEDDGGSGGGVGREIVWLGVGE